MHSTYIMNINDGTGVYIMNINDGTGVSTSSVWTESGFQISDFFGFLLFGIAEQLEGSVLKEGQMNEWMNENLYIAHKKTSTQNLACSQRQM